MVSGCYSDAGAAYLWGANTNSQLGKGKSPYAEYVQVPFTNIAVSNKYVVSPLVPLWQALMSVADVSRDRQLA